MAKGQRIFYGSLGLTPKWPKDFRIPERPLVARTDKPLLFDSMTLPMGPPSSLVKELMRNVVAVETSDGVVMVGTQRRYAGLAGLVFGHGQPVDGYCARCGHKHTCPSCGPGPYF